PERAQSLNQSGFFIAQTVGPALAGLVVATSGAATALWVNAGSFVLSMLIVGLLVDTPPGTTRAVPQSYLDDLREGYRFVFHDPFLRAMLFFVCGFTAFFAPLYSVVYPVFFTRIVESETAFGLFVGFESAGALLGGVAYGIWGQRYSRWKVFIWSMFLWIPFFWPIIIPPDTWILLLLGFFGGLTTGPINPIFHVAFQVRTTEEMRARVNSMITAGSLIGVAGGALLMGPAVEIFGVRWVIAFVALIYSIAPVLVLFWPVFKEIDHDLEPQGAPV
ncbi:MAG: MFS transporter, partial [Chloroflexota bacterium]|nr:MFS transporter [Chloroflexota bacterium]